MTQEKSCSKRTRPTARVSGPCRPPAEIRAAEPRDAGSLIRAAEVEIIEALIAQAKKGNHQVAKFLFDYAGLSHPPAPEDHDPSLAQLLLERLGLDEELLQEEEKSGDHGNCGANLVNGGPRS